MSVEIMDKNLTVFENYKIRRPYDEASGISWLWGDVNMVKEIGATVNPEIIRLLKEVTEHLS